ncbi:hypothetical protein GCM10011324_05690 [Allosediminivita pacifica]|nr:hypothetical protein GCM10011324_05690 [Allosediminivita pacifica]
MLPVAERLCGWISTHPDMAERLHAVRVTFFNAIAATVRTGALASDTERLRLLLPLSQWTLPFIVTGETSGLPHFRKFAPGFAMVHTAAPYAGELLDAA